MEFEPIRPAVAVGKRKAVADSPQTACLRCRNQKLKCSRTKPKCERCVRKGTACNYPPPPDRKQLAAHREYHGQRSQGGVQTSPRSEKQDPALSTRCDPSILPVRQSSLEKGREHWTCSHVSPFIQAPAAPDLIPGPEVAMFLIETYFTHVITSSLLFNYKTLVRDYRASLVPRPVLLSIFAAASLFHRETSLDRSMSTLFPNIGTQGRLWAEMSGQAVRAMAESPSVSTIQACEILSVYWYVMGEPTRAMVYEGISREACRVLEWVARSRDQSRKSRVPLSIRQAQWIHNCLGDYDMVICSGSDACGLDCDEHAESNDNPDGSILENNSWMIWDSSDAKSSAKYFIEGLTLWKETRHLTKRFREGSIRSFATVIFDLDKKLEAFYTSIPTELKQSEPLGQGKHLENAQRNGFCLRSLYHCCSLYLWSSIVPPLSNKRNNTLDLPAGLADFGAMRVIQHIKMFVHSARAYLAIGPEFKKIPPFMGYCAYIAGSIQTRTPCFRSSPGDSLAWAQGMLCFLILEELNAHWPMLNSMYNSLKTHISQADNGLLLLPRNALLDLVSAQCDFGAEWQGPISSEKIFINLDEPGCDPFLHRAYIDFLWDAHETPDKGMGNNMSLHQTGWGSLAGEDTVGECDRRIDRVVRAVEPTEQGFTQDQFLNFDEILSGCCMDAASGGSSELIMHDSLDGQNMGDVWY